MRTDPFGVLAYDPQGRLSTLTDETTPSKRESKWTYNYSAQFPKQVETLTGPAHITKNEFDPQRGHLLSKEQKSLDGKLLARYTYTVNALGQREQVRASGAVHFQPHQWDWSYNDRGEVVAANLKPQAPGLQPTEYTYAYDTIGNRREATQESMNAPIVKSSYTANALNQYSSIERHASSIKPTYDQDGNLLSGDTHRYLWDAENRLQEVQNAQGQVQVRYTYDANHRRVRTDVLNRDGISTSSTLHLYEGWNCIAEVEVASGHTPITRTYVWGMDLSNSLQGAGGVGGLLAVCSSSTLPLEFFPAYDGNGNITAYVKVDGSAAATFTYDAFGNAIHSHINQPELAAFYRYGFSTKPVEPATGWLYYGYRYYDPVIGRWPSRDPIRELGGYNIFSFCSNKPVQYFELLGLRPRSIAATTPNCTVILRHMHGPTAARDWRQDWLAQVSPLLQDAGYSPGLTEYGDPVPFYGRSALIACGYQRIDSPGDPNDSGRWWIPGVKDAFGDIPPEQAADSHGYVGDPFYFSVSTNGGYGNSLAGYLGYIQYSWMAALQEGNALAQQCASDTCCSCKKILVKFEVAADGQVAATGRSSIIIYQDAVERSGLERPAMDYESARTHLPNLVQTPGSPNLPLLPPSQRVEEFKVTKQQ